MSKKTIRVKAECVCYQANGEMFDIPIACLDCHEKGLVLVYNYEKHRMEAVCGMREDAKGRFIPGCDKVSFALLMTKEQYHIIVDDPHTTDYFFYLKTFGDENL